MKKLEEKKCAQVILIGTVGRRNVKTLTRQESLVRVSIMIE